MSLPPLFARISSDTGWPLAQLQQAWAFVPLGSGLVALATGMLLRRRSDRVILCIAGVLAVSSTVMRAVAIAPLGFAVSLFLFGMGSGAVLVVLTSRVGRLFDGKGAAMAQAIFFGAYTFGAAVGLASAEFLAVQLGSWRAVPGAWALLSALALLPALRSSMPPIAAELGGSKMDLPAAGSACRVLRYAFVYAAYVGGYLGLVGFLPYQLREWEWEPFAADAVLAISTLGFIAGSLLWAAITDRFGRRHLTFALCMALTAALTLLVPIAAAGEARMFAVAAITGVGFFSGAMALFFPIVLEDPITGGERATQTIGITTAASYAGGFAVPFFLAPMSDALPTVVVSAYGVAFGCAGAAMLFGSAGDSREGATRIGTA